MMIDDTGIDPRAIDSLSVAPDKDSVDGKPEHKGGSGQGPVQDHEDRLDEALDETMDASDPVSATQPGLSEPAPSSGFDQDAEDDRQAAKP